MVPATSGGTCSLAALTEHLAARDGRGVLSWLSRGRCGRRLGFPFSTRAARVGALVHVLVASAEHLLAMDVPAGWRQTLKHRPIWSSTLY